MLRIFFTSYYSGVIKILKKKEKEKNIMENEMIQEVMENNNEVAENMVYETYPIDEVIADDGSDLKEKLIKGGIFAAGAAAGAITTKVVVPGAKRAFGWAKEHWPFSKKKKSEDTEESETEAKEKEEETEEADVEEKKPDNNNHKKGKKKK